MFICLKCLNCTTPFHRTSFGHCEICEKTRVCADCPPRHEWRAAPPLKKNSLVVAPLRGAVPKWKAKKKMAR